MRLRKPLLVRQCERKLPQQLVLLRGLLGLLRYYVGWLTGSYSTAAALFPGTADKIRYALKEVVASSLTVVHGKHVL